MYGKLVLVLCAVGVAVADYSTTSSPDYAQSVSTTPGYNYNVPEKQLSLPSKSESHTYIQQYEPSKRISPTITSYSETPIVHTVQYSQQNYAPVVSKTVIPAVSYQSTPAPFAFSTPAPSVKVYTPVQQVVPYQVQRYVQQVQQVQQVQPSVSYATPAPAFAKAFVQQAVYASPAPVVAKTYVQPAVSYATPAPAFAKSYVQQAVYASPAPAVAKTYVQPAVSYVQPSVSYASVSQPAVYATAAPAKSYVQYQAISAPAVSYASAPAVSYAAPAVSYVSAPVAKTYAAPLTSFVGGNQQVFYTSQGYQPAFTYGAGQIINSPEVSFIAYKKKK